MSIINRSTRVIVLTGSLLLASLPGGLQAAQWSASLKDGGTVTVDPQTNRATVRRNGVETPLWDGVHQLEDGSTLTIRSGTAIPTQSILRARQLPESPEPPVADQGPGIPIIGDSPCERLAQRVCGTNRACGAVTACGAVEQLLNMERNERKAAASPDVMTPSSKQCLQADKDRAYFVTCSSKTTPGK